MTRPSVRTLLAVVAACAAVTLALPAQAAPVVGCVKVADAKGDTAPAADPALDLTGFSLTTVGKRLVATVTVAQASPRPMLSPDSRTEVLFTIGGRRVLLFAKNSLQREQEANAFFQQGIRVDNVFVSGDVEATFAGNTLTIKVKRTTLRTALAANVEGVPFTDVQALARANYVYQDANVTYDSADAAKGTRFQLGAPCR